MPSSFLNLPYNIYIFLFGAYIAIRIACGAFSARQWRFFALAAPLLLLIQGVVMQLLSTGAVRLSYPLIAHLPLVLLLVFFLRVNPGVALISMITSYGVCQLPRFIGLLLEPLHLAIFTHTVSHLALCHLLLMLLDRFCLSPIHDVISASPRLLISFGALPTVYYLFEYFMLYTESRYAHILAFSELLPTLMVLSFILLVVAYQREADKRRQAQQLATALEVKFSQTENELAALRTIEEKTALYRHDLRHHLMMIDGLIASGRIEQAATYIRETQNEVAAITSIRYCQNETVNLLLCAFSEKIKACGADFIVKAALPKTLSLPDTELCTILSNGLENALHAVRALPEGTRSTIEVFLSVKQNNLLLEIRNPYEGEVIMKDGLPLRPDGQTRYGCRSIRSIVQRHGGLCSFEAAASRFVLRLAIPLSVPASGVYKA